MIKPLTDLLERREVQRIIGLAGWEPVVLLGSAARRRRTAVSDLDLLVIHDEWPYPRSPAVHLVVLSHDALRQRVADGDDFVYWAAQFGRPLHGRTKWELLRVALLGELRWPRPERKLDHFNMKRDLAAQLLELGDFDAAHEELKKAAGQLARYWLLCRQVAPLSRPELPLQLQEVGSPELGALLRMFDAEKLPEHAIHCGADQLTRIAAAMEVRVST